MFPYQANTDKDVEEMLSVIGVSSIDDLFSDIMENHKPVSFRIPDGLSEMEAVSSIRKLASKNRADLISFLGGGFYDHYIPAVVPSLSGRSEFYTAYTPYQPECAQGTLQGLFEFQSMICTLTAMEAANASLYDGGTALFEAVLMAMRITKRSHIVIDGCLNPIYQTLLETYLSNLNFKYSIIPPAELLTDSDKVLEAVGQDTAAVIFQNPNFFGSLQDQTAVCQKIQKKGALVVMSVYPVSLGLVKTPGEMGADIVTGEGQSMGLPLNFGGPYLGFMATRKKYIRKMPGRIIGETLDRDGKRCYVNTLQAREQHIRREKATSNICTNVSLCALQALIFMSTIGKQGLVDLARINMSKTRYLMERLNHLDGICVSAKVPVFNEFVVEFLQPGEVFIKPLLENGYLAGFPLGRYYPEMGNCILVNVTEKRTKIEMDSFVDAVKGVVNRESIREGQEAGAT